MDLFIVTFVVVIRDDGAGFHIHMRSDDGITYEIEMSERRMMEENTRFNFTTRTNRNMPIEENTTSQISMRADETSLTHNQRSFEYNMRFNDSAFMNRDITADFIFR